MGISFAIPIDEAIRISEQLKSNGRIVRGRIGITITELTKELAESMGFNLKSKGLLVRGIEAGAPAAMSGIEVGDVIVKINDREIEKTIDLTRTISDIKPGNRVKIQVWRKGSIREINVMVVEVDVPRRP
jgi:serine protease Do